MAEEENPEAGEEKKSGKLKLIIIIVVALAVLAGGAMAIPAVRHMIFPPPEEGEEVEVEEVAGPPIYQSLHPPLVVNFSDAFGDAHYMQVTMEVMSRDQEVVNAVRDHTPAIRSALILHFSSADYDVVTTREGKEAMLEEALQEVRNVMQEQIGEESAAEIEAVYFTGLVIQ